MEVNNQCSLCLDPTLLTNENVSEDNLKAYQAIYACCRTYLRNEIIKDWYDWSKGDRLISPFCKKCFNSAEIILQTNQELKRIKENMKRLVKKFRREVIQRTSKNLNPESVNEISVFIKEENDDSIKEEVDPFLEEEQGVDPFHEEEVGSFHEEEQEVDPFFAEEQEVDPFSDSDENNEFPSSNDEEREDVQPNDELKYPNNRRSKRKVFRPKSYYDDVELDVDLERLGKRKNKELEYESSISKEKRSVPTNLLKCVPTFYLKCSAPGALSDKCEPLIDIERKSSFVNSDEIVPSAYQETYSTMRNEAGQLVCDICGKPYKTENVLLTHRLSHNGEYEVPFKCLICNQGFNLHEMFEKHAAIHVKESSYEYECDSCPRRFQDKYELKRHSRTHDKNYCPFKCSICKERFQTKYLLSDHCKMIHKKEEKFICEICNKSFGVKHKLLRHRLNVHSSNKLKCDKCNKFYKNEMILREHLFKVHKTKFFYFCDKCESKFRKKSELSNHIRTVHGKKLYPCSKCNKTFENTTRLKKHEETHTDVAERRNIKCEIYVEKYFATFSGLWAHQKQAHTVFTHGFTGEKSYSFTCEICGKTFAMKEYLKTHLNVHSGEKPFVCEVCGTAFALRCNLNQHILTHTGEKPHLCTVCGKSFRKSYHLKTHVRIHTGEKPYSCAVCGKTFSDRSTWYKHDKKHPKTYDSL